MNSTETPGGSGIPAGWYDDPSGQGLRWWDGEQWTEHVHTAESAAASVAGDAREGEREAPPPQLVKLRESIQARGAKGVGMVLGGLVLVIVVVTLLLSGGSDNSSGKAATPHTAAPGRNVVLEREIKSVNKQLKNKNLPKAQTKKLKKELKTLEKELAGSGGLKGSKNGKSGQQGKSGKQAKSGKSAEQKKTPGEEGG